MNLKSLLYIVTIAEEKNLSKAAKRLYVSQSTLSLFLKNLEKELGVSLFTRTQKQLQITPFGEDYVQTARQILEIKDRLYKTIAARAEQPRMNIGISSLLVRNIFSSLLEENASKDLIVNLQEGRTPAVIEKLKNHTLDTAIVGWDSIMSIDDCAVQVLNTELISIVIGPTHPCAHLASTDYDNPPIVSDMSQLDHEKWVLTPHDTIDYKLAARIYNDYDLHPNIIYEINDTASLCRLVMTGSCLSAIPEYCVPRNQGVLVCRPPQDYCRYMLLIQNNEHHPVSEETDLINKLISRYQNLY